MTHVLHSVIISYNRRELTEQALTSYLETVTLPYTLVIVDNNSEEETREWIARLPCAAILLPENKYPGFACNRGWEKAPDGATLLHRADNDFRFLPGWCDEVVERFKQNPDLGQLGLRTDAEELYAPFNVGGNNVIRRELWDAGLRYQERPWTQYAPGYSEDSYMSPAVLNMGWQWGRVQRPCIESLASGDWNDPYYAASYGDRRIPRPD